jgi:hypothetical protein
VVGIKELVVLQSHMMDFIFGTECNDVAQQFVEHFVLLRLSRHFEFGCVTKRILTPLFEYQVPLQIFTGYLL